MKCLNCGKDMVKKEAKHHHPYWQCSECGTTTTDLEAPVAFAFGETWDDGPTRHYVGHPVPKRRRKKHGTTNSTTS